MVDRSARDLATEVRIPGSFLVVLVKILTGYECARASTIKYLCSTFQTDRLRIKNLKPNFRYGFLFVN